MQENLNETQQQLPASPEVAQVQQETPQPQAAAVPEQAVPAQPVSEFDALDKSGEIEKQKFDPTPFIGKDSFIEFIEERKGNYGFYIKCLSQVVDEGESPIRASVIFGLNTNDGKLGWIPGSKLDVFLKKFNATHYRDLLQNPTIEVLKDDAGEQYRRISGGFKTQIKIQTRSATDGKEYLTF